MLAKKERLTRALFDRSFSDGKRYHNPALQLIVSKSETFHGSVVVGKKVFKKAVDRNRLRRRLYSVLYEWRKKSTNTYIVIAKAPITQMPKILYTQTLRDLLSQSESL